MRVPKTTLKFVRTNFAYSQARFTVYRCHKTKLLASLRLKIEDNAKALRKRYAITHIPSNILPQFQDVRDRTKLAS